MLFYDFTTTTYGKWILVGEHAVVRGHGALVFPVKEKKLILKYQASSLPLSIDYVSADENAVASLYQVLEHALSLVKHSLEDIKGHFYLENTIPIGSGMGASAALCVALSRWFVAQNFIEKTDCLPFARELEHLFHGKSSGLDIAGVSAEQGIYFKAGESYPINQKNQPLFYLSSCNEMGVTSHCVQKVQQLWQSDSTLAQHLDEQMVHVVHEAKSLLEEGLQIDLVRLAQVIDKAKDCFLRWGLISGRLEQHMQQLTEAGALAVKPTGSGGGGFVLSLWKEPPPSFLGLVSAQ